MSFVSGDVHCAAVAAFHTCPKKDHRIAPAEDPKYMVQIVTSAIVNTPPPALVGSMVSRLGEKRHKTLHCALRSRPPLLLSPALRLTFRPFTTPDVNTDEEMIHHFPEDTDGTTLKHNTIMGRRSASPPVARPAPPA